MWSISIIEICIYDLPQNLITYLGALHLTPLSIIPFDLFDPFWDNHLLLWEWYLIFHFNELAFGFLNTLQQKWAMVTKASEDKQFRHQMITFSEEKKNSSPNISKILKLVTKSIFRHQRCTDWWRNQYFITKDAQIGDEIFISSL